LFFSFFPLCGIFIVFTVWSHTERDIVTIVQYSTVQNSTVQHCTVPYSTVQYSTVHYSTVPYITVQCSTVQYRDRHSDHCTIHWRVGMEYIRVHTKHTVTYFREHFLNQWIKKNFPFLVTWSHLFLSLLLQSPLNTIPPPPLSLSHMHSEAAGSHKLCIFFALLLF